MGKEQPASFYDAVYTESKTYDLAPEDAPWYPLWRVVDSRIPDAAIVFDVGCGPGHMAKLLHGRVRAYQGIDFSGKAIQQARARVPGITFRWADAFDFEWPDADVYLFLEVLEHVNRDVDLLCKVPAGKRAIISVPHHDAAGHVRHFETAKSVTDRYGGAVAIEGIEQVEKNWFVAEGLRR